MLKKPLLLFFLCISSFVQAQTASTPYWYGTIHVLDRSTTFTDFSGVEHTLRWRMFTVDTSSERQFFGVHYENLKPYVQDNEKTIASFQRAVIFEKSQQVCLAGSILAIGAYAVFKPHLPAAVEIPLLVTFPAGMLVAHICKRVSIGTCIRRHNNLGG